MAEKKNRFNLRSFTSFSLVISTIIMSWSGFILYVAPPGRIANWGTWKLMLFTKSEWQALHTIFSYLFFILVIIHLFFVNWKTFLTYIKSKLKAGINRRAELVTAVVLSGIIFVGTLKSWTPFGPVMTFGEKAKGSWEGQFEAPPVLHMEIYTLSQLSPLFDSIPPAQLKEALTENNIIVNGENPTLERIAADNKLIPSQVYDILVSKFKKPVDQKTGENPQGIGKYTLKDAADKSGKKTEDLISILKKQGIKATGGTTLKELATQMGMTPRDVFTLLTGEGR
jgi:hypothetical protein